ncbi:Ubiquitin thioesterase otubain-like protein [Nosema bombycis CQ1]|uniref:ubiquitinyl hydrolase 1 n=1 Tax=Nosema bombycis (strain CQ1 / CVCC 102059) TaxID=578461 RepID=R0MM43_NOSB1|nr:Ubiquitin thioesterase otubain-like protein [Nosema bombycis CQ1]|eukprot:EOB13883.1 Ubiquitin thioesterase otubain-like protein [Nosema bombycis CQ1]
MENKKEEQTYVSEKKKIVENRSYMDSKFKSRLDHTGIKYFREIARDGNCMYLAIGVQIVDKLQTNPDFKDKFNKTLEDLIEKFKSLKLEEFTYSDYMNTLKENMDVEIQKIDKYSWYEIVGLLRLITSTELRINKEMYLPYIPDITIEQYCKSQVDPFFVEAGYLEIGALVNILPIQIEVIDITEQTSNYSRMYGNEGEVISILHTPNHFEAVYY